MSTFYVLPARENVARGFADYLKTVFPGMEWQETEMLTSTLEELAELRPDVVVVFQDDIDESEDLNETLQECFGAEEEDLIVEVPVQSAEPTIQPRIWRMAA